MVGLIFGIKNGIYILIGCDVSVCMLCGLCRRFVWGTVIGSEGNKCFNQRHCYYLPASGVACPQPTCSARLPPKSGIPFPLMELSWETSVSDEMILDEDVTHWEKERHVKRSLFNLTCIHSLIQSCSDSIGITPLWDSYPHLGYQPQYNQPPGQKQHPPTPHKAFLVNGVDFTMEWEEYSSTSTMDSIQTYNHSAFIYFG